MDKNQKRLTSPDTFLKKRYPKISSKPQSNKPLSPIPTYPRLVKRDPSQIELVLRNPPIPSNSLHTDAKVNLNSTKDNHIHKKDNEEWTQHQHAVKELKISHKIYTQIFVFADSIIAVLMVFILIYMTFKEVIEFFKKPLCIVEDLRWLSAQGENCEGTVLRVFPQVMRLSLCFLMSLLLLTEFLPGGKNMSGFNNIKNRSSSPLKMGLEYLGVTDLSFWVPFFRILLFIVVMTLLKSFYNFGLPSLIVTFISLSYLSIISILNHFLKIFGIETFHTKNFFFAENGISKVPKDSSKEDPKENMKFLLPLDVFGAILMIIQIILSSRLRMDLGIALCLGMYILFTLIFIVLVVQQFLKESIEKLPKRMQSLLTFFILYFCLHTDTRINPIAGLVLSVTHLLFLIATLSIEEYTIRKSRKNQGEKGHHPEPKLISESYLKTLQKFNYCFIFSTALFIITGTVYCITSESVSGENSAYFLRDLVQERIGPAIAVLGIDFVDSEELFNVLTMAMESILWVFVIGAFYYVISERTAQFNHGYLSILADVLFLLVLISKFHVGMFRHVVEETWAAVKEEDTIDSVEINIIFNICNLLLSFVIALKVIDFESHYGQVVGGVIANTTEEESPKKRTFHFEHLINHFFSAFLTIVILVSFFRNVDFTTSAMVSIKPQDFQTHNVETYTLVDADCSSSKSSLAEKKLDLESLFELVKYYAKNSEATELFGGAAKGFMIALPLVILLLPLLINILGVVSKNARKWSTRVSATALVLGFPCLMFAVAVVPVIYVVNLSIEYPVRELKFSPMFRHWFVLSGTCIFGPLISLVEKYFGVYALESGESNDSVDVGGEEENLILY